MSGYKKMIGHFIDLVVGFFCALFVILVFVLGKQELIEFIRETARL